MDYMCYLQHVQLHSRIREELNQELPSHYAWGQEPSLLTQKWGILQFKNRTFISASESQSGLRSELEQGLQVTYSSVW